MDKNITKARAYFYEFLAYPLFFHTSDEKFARWKEQLSYLAQNPLSEQSAEAFANLDKFSFKELVNEQNEVLFGFTNIPLSASFYEEGRDNGAARLRVIHCLNLSPYRRDKELCKDSEDYVGFIFLAMATFLNDEFNGAKNISDKLFGETLNLFIDEFGSLLLAHKNANFFRSYALILQDFIKAIASRLQRLKKSLIKARCQLLKLSFTGRNSPQSSHTSLKTSLNLLLVKLGVNLTSA